MNNPWKKLELEWKILIFASFLFIGFILYGIMQGGSELSWKMSGLIFSKKEEDSAPYTLVNILTVGIRGIIFPYFTYGLLMISNIYLTLSIGIIFCLLATAYMYMSSKISYIKPILE